MWSGDLMLYEEHQLISLLKLKDSDLLSPFFAKSGS